MHKKRSLITIFITFSFLFLNISANAVLKHQNQPNSITQEENFQISISSNQEPSNCLETEINLDLLINQILEHRPNAIFEKPEDVQIAKLLADFLVEDIKTVPKCYSRENFISMVKIKAEIENYYTQKITTIESNAHPKPKDSQGLSPEELEVQKEWKYESYLMKNGIFGIHFKNLKKIVEFKPSIDQPDLLKLESFGQKALVLLVYTEGKKFVYLETPFRSGGQMNVHPAFFITGNPNQPIIPFVGKTARKSYSDLRALKKEETLEHELTFNNKISSQNSLIEYSINNHSQLSSFTPMIPVRNKLNGKIEILFEERFDYDLVDYLNLNRNYLWLDFTNDREKLIKYRSEIISIFYQIAKQLSHIHSNKIVYADMKPENILIRNLGSKIDARLTDLGLAHFEDELNHKFGTNFYNPPEFVVRKAHNLNYLPKEKSKAITYLNEETYIKRRDIYSFGLTMLQAFPVKSELNFIHDACGDLQTWELMLDCMSQFQQWVTINLVNQKSDCDKDQDCFGKIIRDCLAVLPKDRPSAEELATRIEKILHQVNLPIDPIEYFDSFKYSKPNKQGLSHNKKD